MLVNAANLLQVAIHIKSLAAVGNILSKHCKAACRVHSMQRRCVVWAKCSWQEPLSSTRA
jgi:hypothetical protein